jgi:hypothetical protein
VSLWPPSVRAQLAATAVLSTVFAILLAFFPPQLYALYPACPFHEWLGLQCPGCGMTRALADLITGRVREAAQHNALSLVLAPVAAGFASVQSYSVLRWNRWRQVSLPRGWVAVAWLVVLIFGLTRNLSTPGWTIR